MDSRRSPRRDVGAVLLEGSPHPEPWPGAFGREDQFQLCSIGEALSATDEVALSADRVGLGSTVHVKDLKTRERTVYQVVPLDLVEVGGKGNRRFADWVGS